MELISRIDLIPKVTISEGSRIANTVTLVSLAWSAQEALYAFCSVIIKHSRNLCGDIIHEITGYHV